MGRVLPGWVWLGLTVDKQLIITQTNNEDNTLMQGITQVHSYFVQYEGSKEAYVDSLWRHIDWEKVCSNFENYNLEGGKVAPLLD